MSVFTNKARALPLWFTSAPASIKIKTCHFLPCHVWCTTSNLLLSMVVFCLNPYASVNLYSRCLLLFNKLNIIYYHKHNSFICCFIAKNPDWQQYDSTIYRQSTCLDSIECGVYVLRFQTFIFPCAWTVISHDFTV